MQTKTIAAVTATALALVVGALAGSVLLGGSGVGAVPGAQSGTAIDQTELASFETTAPACGAPRSSNATSGSRPVGGGTQLTLNRSIPVPSRDAELEASLAEVGPGRYVLDIDRRPDRAEAAPDCHLEVRYVATLNLTESTRYTVLVTYDDELKQVYWSEPGSSGAYGRVSAPERYASANDSSGGSASAKDSSGSA